MQHVQHGDSSRSAPPYMLQLLSASRPPPTPPAACHATMARTTSRTARTAQGSGDVLTESRTPSLVPQVGCFLHPSRGFGVSWGEEETSSLWGIVALTQKKNISFYLKEIVKY